MPSIDAPPRHARAILATAELLARLKTDFVLVGGAARAAWLGGEASGPVDVLALMAGQQKNQLAMMAANRGFRVEREELEQAEELDLVPIRFADDEGDVRVHVLLASNSLYARMIEAGREAEIGGTTVRVAAPEDLALLLTMADDEVSVRRLAALESFDRASYNERLVSIGLGELVLAG